MKTFQLVIFVSVVGLALYQVLSSGYERNSKDDVLVVRQKPSVTKVIPQNIKKSTNNFSGSVRSSVKSSANEIGLSSERIDSQIFDPAAAARRTRDQELRNKIILEESWAAYFNEWNDLYLMSNSSNPMKISSDNICELFLIERDERITITDAFRVKTESNSIVLYDDVQRIELAINSNQQQLFVATSELVKFCQEVDWVASYVQPR